MRSSSRSTIYVFLVLSLYGTLTICPARAASVSTSSPEATRVAMNVLKSGGNAVDAACAAGFVLNVTQPYFTGIGGGGWMLFKKKDAPAQHLDFISQAPKAGVSAKYFVGPDGKPIESWSERNTGPRSVMVPGFVAGCGQAIKEWGTKNWEDLVMPAAQLAQEGFLISQMYFEESQEQWARIASFELTRSIFGGVSGNGVVKDEVLKQPMLAATLERIAKEGPGTFYKGKLAEEWLQEARASGVKISKADLEAYQPLRKEPISFRLDQFTGITAAPSSAAGLMVGEVLRFIDQYYQGHPTPKPDSATRYIVTIEATSYFADLRAKRVSDVKRNKIDIQKYAGSNEELRAFAAINRRVAKRLSRIMAMAGKKARRIPAVALKRAIVAPRSLASQKRGHTAHISVLDDSGNIVAFTSSIGNIYGSAITVPKFGFLLNSDMGGFSEQPKDLNAPGPELRYLSNQSPTIISMNNKKSVGPVAILGGAGGELIPSAIVQFFENYFFHKLPAVDAIKLARVHPGEGDKIQIEKSAPDDVIEKLVRAGYEVEVADTIWAVHEAVVRRTPSSPWEAVAETRYDGLGLSN